MTGGRGHRGDGPGGSQPGGRRPTVRGPGRWWPGGRGLTGRDLISGAALLVLVLFLAAPQRLGWALEPLTHNGAPAIYDQTALWRLALSHLGLVGAGVLAATLVAVGLGILVTRGPGREFLPLARTVTAIGQTFPPVAVLALAVPVMGFGPGPTLVALFLYGLLPVFENTLGALANLPAPVIEAARGMGMTPRQRLVQVELPLAMPLILAGVRVTAVISLGTATIGSTVAAHTLGEVIIAGLLSSNTAFVVQGGLVVGLLAVLLDDLLRRAERALARRMRGA